MVNIGRLIRRALTSELVKNSFFGIAANFVQTVSASLLFIILARKYTTTVFAEFLLAMTLYQLVVAFSAMGLGQWFIRQYADEPEKLTLTGRFLKTQIGFGLFFYFLNIVFALFLYPDGQIRILSVILGTNIIFDNIIFAIRNLNIAENKQKKTAAILAIDGVVKLLVGSLLFIYPFSIISLSVFLIFVRFFTVNLFINIGVSKDVSFRLLWGTKISIVDVKELVAKNWRFVVIGSISVIYWRLAHIIISKMLSMQDVANYEIAFRIFSVMLMLPIIASATIFPKFVKSFNENDYQSLRRFYKSSFIFYSLFSLIFYAFVISFADRFIPYAFGKEYLSAIACVKQMFLTSLFLPTVLLQANLIVAMKLEKLDMRFSIYSLVLNVVGCLIGLSFYKSLSVINYSIFASIIAFHLLQDILLVKKKITNYMNSVLFYLFLASFIVAYNLLSESLNPYIVFSGFLALILIGLLALIFSNKRILHGSLFATRGDKQHF